MFADLQPTLNLTTPDVPLDQSSAGDLVVPENRRASGAAQPVRVCHISMCLATGGLERLLVEFARLRDRLRFEMEFMALSREGQPATDIRVAGCSATVLNETQDFRKWQTLKTLARRLREGHFDVVHTHNTFAHFYGTIAAKWAGVPVVVNTQHGRGCGGHWKAKWQFRLANRLTQRIVGVSHDSVELCQADDRGSAGKMIAIWNGIDLARFSRESAVAGRRDADTITAISVARLSREKDFPTLLHAVRSVVNRVPTFRLRIVGDGPERATIERVTAELNLCDHVELLGERHDVAEQLSQADFFVSATRSEGISLTLLEAMAVGLPIVTTRVGGNPEIVIDGQTGRLVADNDPDALAQAILELCHDRNSWSEMGRHGRARVEQHFDIRQMVANYEALYEELVRR